VGAVVVWTDVPVLGIIPLVWETYVSSDVTPHRWREGARSEGAVVSVRSPSPGQSIQGEEHCDSKLGEKHSGGIRAATTDARRELRR
jgi:hypothetical protein